MFYIWLEIYCMNEPENLLRISSMRFIGFQEHPKFSGGELVERNVVITGLECMTALGNDADSTWNALLKDVSGISKIDRFNTEHYACQFGGQIKGFNARKSGLTSTNTMLKYNQYELFTIMKAVSKYNWIEDSNENNIDCPVYFGNQSINLDQDLYDTLINISGKDAENLNLSAIGSRLNEFPPLNGIKLLPTLPAHFTAKQYDLHGSANILYSGESSSIDSILHAVSDIEMGYYDKAIVASTFSPFSPHEFFWLTNSKLVKRTFYDHDESQLVFPFDKRHDGLVYGEGAGVILIESEQSARDNGRNILAYIGGGMTNNFPDQDFYTLNKEGFIKNLKATLSVSSLRPDDVDLIYANAPSYPDWDNPELEAIYEIWMEHDLSVTSSKSSIGFLGCAAGMIDCILAVKALNENTFARIKNFEQLDDSINFDCSKYFRSKNKDIQNCLINCAGIGAHYSSLILKKGV